MSDTAPRKGISTKLALFKSKGDTRPGVLRWPLSEHFGQILGGFEVWVYMPSSRTASPENELLGISGLCRH
ncbi:hypothetical protein L3X38_036660 [Prunus dulcis]|uniref:Uncharacterized protein n=1 Tax=Prunus dulcis TaxID=3755 RepID=A0AAD4V261_PRUDU|nr:hypothetical protein L3X38_036660 [Prunus dulcis]